MTTASYLIPIKTVSALNEREHWRAKAKRVKAEREATALIVKPFPTPCIVRLVRLSPGELDDDAVPGACKAIRDEIARLCGCGDSPRDPITWVYAQEKCKRGTFGVRVEMLAV